MKWIKIILTIMAILFATSIYAIELDAIKFQKIDSRDQIALSMAQPLPQNAVSDSLDKASNTLILVLNNVTYTGTEPSIPIADGNFIDGQIKIETITKSGVPDITSIKIPLKVGKNHSLVMSQSGPDVLVSLEPVGITSEEDLVEQLKKEVEKQAAASAEQAKSRLAAKDLKAFEKEYSDTIIEPALEYQDLGKRDPFRILFQTKQKRDRLTQKQKPPNIAGAEVQSIISNADGRKIALVWASGGYFFLEEGDLLADGVVGKITDFEVTFRLSEEGWDRDITVGIKQKVDIVK